jgi:uncharacterized protein
MFTAIKNNNISQVRKLVLEHWNDRWNGTTALCYACKLCRNECIAILAPCGNINVSGNDNTPLSHMIWYDQLVEVELLLELGADPNIGNMLYMATIKQNIHIVTLLLKYGALPNIKQHDYPLDLAINYRNEALISLLSQHHVVINNLNSLYEIIHRPDLIMGLIRNNYQFTYHGLYASIHSSDETMVRLFLDHGLSSKDHKSNNALHQACKYNDIGMIRIILSYDININEVNDKGRSPLFLIGNDEIIKLLLDNGADINIQDYKGNTVLHDAVKLKLFNLTKVLLSYGVDPLIRNNKGLIARDLINQWDIEDFNDEDNLMDITSKFEMLIAPYEDILIKEPSV